MKYYGEENVKCPFYCSENKNNIFCQGLTDNTQTVSNFTTPSNKKSHKLNYCERYSYMDCPYAKLLDELIYTEENKMSKTTKQKLESASKHIRDLKHTLDSANKTAEREINALRFQVEWREKELKRQKAAVCSTELLTKYLLYALNGEEEVRVPIRDLATFQEKYDVIVVRDEGTNEIVCTLYDKEKKQIIDGNYNSYMKYSADMILKHGKGKVYSDYIRVKPESDKNEEEKVLKQAEKNIMKMAQEIKFPDNIRKKLKFKSKIFKDSPGSYIVAWYAVEK